MYGPHMESFMLMRILIAFGCLVSSHIEAQALLTDLEIKWINAGGPVLAYAKELKLPIDIIVQPETKPDDVPLAMGFQDGRCKLVFSMRGNPQAEAVLTGVPPAQHDLMIEAMTAHEIGHCWRNAHGTWNVLPTGFTEIQENADDSTTLARLRQIRITRREEGFADLAALAWIHQRHPDQYAQVYAWFEQIRNDQPIAKNAHDTRVWIRLVKDRAVFEATADTPFEQVRTLWNKGLLNDG